MLDGQNHSNEELETNHSEHEDHSTSEGNDEASQEQAERTYTRAELEAELERERKERDKRWRERIKKAQGDDGGEESREKADHSQKVVSDDATIARLEARGILDSDLQEYIIGEASRLQTSPIQLLSDEYYQSKIEQKKKEKERAAATPSPSGRTGTTDKSKDVNYWVQQAQKGISAPTAEMRKAVRQRIARR